LAVSLTALFGSAAPALAATCNNDGFGTLTVSHSLDETVTLSVLAGSIQVRGAGGLVICGGPPPTTANIANISASGQAGNEALIVDRAPGSFGAVNIQANLSFGGDDRLVLLGTAGNDTFVIGTTGFNVDGDADADDLTLSNVEEVEVQGFHGDDVLSGAGSSVAGAPFGGPLMLVGGLGNDRVTGGNGDDRLLSGGDGDDSLDGANGDDRLQGGSGVDQVIGGTGKDDLAGDGGEDRLDGMAGDDVLRGGDGGDQLLGSADSDRLMGGVGNDDLDGGGGIDTADYSDAPGPVAVDLFAASASGNGDDLLSDVENATGSPFADQLIGNGNNNTLAGGGGDDTLDGGFSGDILNGGDGDDVLLAPDSFNSLNGQAGSDTVDYSAFPFSVSVDLTSGGASSGDALSGVENLAGTNLADTFQGDENSNRLSGGGGSDSLDGGLGADVLRGGSGSDTATYATRAASVNVTVDGDANDGSEGEGDDVGGDIENVIGGAGSDVLVGNEGPNTLNGGSGNDTLEGGFGNDSIEGAAGADTVDYSNADTGVTVNLSSGAATGQGTDILSSVENAVGSPFADTLSSDNLIANLNRLTGGAGDDALFGGDGVEILEGGEGNDTVAGDDGNDTLDAGQGADSLNGGTGNDALDAGAGSDTVIGGGGDDALVGGDGTDVASYSLAAAAVLVDLAAGSAFGAEGVDSLAEIENVVGSASSDTLRGDGGNNLLSGGGGADTLVGREGHDWLNGESGADTLSGREGDDELNGGSELDTADYSGANGAVRVDLAGLTAVGEGSDSLTLIENVVGSPFADTLAGDGLGNTLVGGEGDDRLSGRLGNDTLGGGGGVDIASYSDASGGVTVNLSTGTATGAGTDGLSSIESAVGSPFGDVLTGDAGDNALSGEAGADSLDGGAGRDRLSGGPGDDVVTYVNHPVAVSVSLDGTPNDGAAGENDDVGADVESVTGSAFADTLVGNGGPNALSGGNGDDTLDGQEGTDTLAGGAGSDAVDYSAASGAVVIDLAAGSVSGADNDTVTAIENAVGSSFDDSLTGPGPGSVNTRLAGGPGDDTLKGDAAAQDEFLGGDGTDTVTYENHAAVNVTIDDVANDGSPGEEDNVRADVENLVGGLGNDTLTGSAGSNVLDGEGGSDTFSGGGGIDTVTYAAEVGPVTVSIDGTSNDGLPGEGDNVTETVENVVGGAGDDTISGSGAANVLTGSSGADTLAGAGGDDTVDGGQNDDALDGGSGSDTLSGGAGDDVLDGGFGADTLFGNDGSDVLDGGPDDDLLDGGAGVDDLSGGDGNDTLDGGADPDRLEGDSGVDHATYAGRVGALDVTLDGSPNDGESGEVDNVSDDVENVTGGVGDDSITGNSAANILDGGSGSDTLTGADGKDVLIGGLGDDSLDGGNGDDVLSGGVGDDSLEGGLGADHLSGGTGIDGVTYAGRATPVAVTTNNIANDGEDKDRNGSAEEGDNVRPNVENVTGGSNADILIANSSRNGLSGGPGDDLLDGGLGADILSGGPGSDTVTYATRSVSVDASLDGVSNDGQAGEADAVGIPTGNPANDPDVENIIGGAGSDVLVGSTSGGANTTPNILTGGAGSDVLDGAGGQDRVLESGNVSFTLTNTTLTGLGSDALVNIELATLVGGAGNNVINTAAFTGAVRVDGGAGNDTLTTGGGGDTLIGGAGSDKGKAGAGNDTMLLRDRTKDVFDGQTGRDRAQIDRGIDSVKAEIFLR
jgi:Ca2+-binding RTX toxin-like protein